MVHIHMENSCSLNVEMYRPPEFSESLRSQGRGGGHHEGQSVSQTVIMDLLQR